jgi:hypothetical protein
MSQISSRTPEDDTRASTLPDDLQTSQQLTTPRGTSYKVGVTNLINSFWGNTKKEVKPSSLNKTQGNISSRSREDPVQIEQE